MKETKQLFKAYEGKFEIAEPFGKPFVVSALIYETGELLFENKVLYGYIQTSKEYRGVGHVTFTDPYDGAQFVRWRASDKFKSHITNETTNIILLKVLEKEKKDSKGDKIKYFFIKECVVTNEDGSRFLK